MNKSLRIATFPWRNRSKTNPYADSFYGALAPHGITCLDELEFTDYWLSRRNADFDVLHIEWPEMLWPRKGAKVVKRLRAILGMRSFLRLAARQGKQRMVTIHNTRPHESFDWIDRIGYCVVARNTDLLICHSRDSAELMKARDCPKGEIVLMRHGNYDGQYPPPRDRDTVRRELGLDARRPVVGCFGLIREYKGFDLACEAIGALDSAVQLLIAGRPHEGFPIEDLASQVESSGSAHLLARHLSEQEFSDYVSACDLVLLPYRKITGSGALLAAWSLGRPVIASDLPFFAEMMDEFPEAGRLFTTNDAKSLAHAIRDFLTVDQEKRNCAARSAADSLSWENCVRPLVARLKDGLSVV